MNTRFKVDGYGRKFTTFLTLFLRCQQQHISNSVVNNNISQTRLCHLETCRTTHLKYFAYCGKVVNIIIQSVTTITKAMYMRCQLCISYYNTELLFIDLFLRTPNIYLHSKCTLFPIASDQATAIFFLLAQHMYSIICNERAHITWCITNLHWECYSRIFNIKYT